jgi:hypothetical protein
VVSRSFHPEFFGVSRIFYPEFFGLCRRFHWNSSGFVENSSWGVRNSSWVQHFQTGILQGFYKNLNYLGGGLQKRGPQQGGLDFKCNSPTQCVHWPCTKLHKREQKDRTKTIYSGVSRPCLERLCRNRRPVYATISHNVVTPNPTSYHFRPKCDRNFRTQYKSIQNLQAYIFRILQHFGTNFTNFSMLFLAVVIYLHLLA